MSIPPLVCSTPPPPDQCDDKDHEDFDLQYNLSQDDEEENYDYGSFSTYNNYQSPCKIESPKSSKVIENVKNCETLDVKKDTKNVSSESDSGTNSICNTTLKQEEDIIEDLNLHVESEIEGYSKEIKNSNTVINDTNIDKEASIIEEHLQDVSNAVSKSDLVTTYSNTIESSNEPISLVPMDEQLPYMNSDKQNDLTIKASASDMKLDQVLDSSGTNAELSVIENPEKPITNIEDDDFGDFDDFQFAATKTTPAIVIVDSADNPWGSKDIEDDENFENFTANFDGQNISEDTNKQLNSEHCNAIAVNKQKEDNEYDDDDDFGAFDDFKSSTLSTNVNLETAETTPCQEHAIFNLQSDNEEQFLERIDKVLPSIFEEVIIEPVEEFYGKLESMLGETWGYLLETEVRQPYILDWNNSLGQKNLLRALCIDSRNILFGPKWSSNMPKYAANLSAAPLQPKKQSIAPSYQADSRNPIKCSDKPTSTWSDPFTSDGQEFTYAEALLLDLEHLMATLDQMAHTQSNVKISELLSHACSPDAPKQNVVLETGPTDLDVFEASTSSKPDNIYSCTLNVQPLRQINLPDTHIFTPTDSETPHSKTIHYESSSTINLPQAPIKSQTMQDMPLRAPDTDDYWEFQDFKGTSILPVGLTGQSISEPSNSTLNANVIYGIHVLQPIKVETIQPTLNWPDPGEVKEIFDDFSDFISSTCINEATETAAAANTKISDVNTAVSVPSTSQFITNHEAVSSSSNRLDDEFDTFQSAAPSKTFEYNMNNVTKDLLTNKTDLPIVTPHIPADFDIAFSKSDCSKSDPNTSHKKDNLPSKSLSVASNHINEMLKLQVKHVPLQLQSLPLSSSLLQPTTINSSDFKQNHQKSGQILQPLSLESYSQINWPNPGIDLQDLSRFNPVETLNSLKTDLSTNSQGASPVHNLKCSANNQPADDDWGDFVSSKPKLTQLQPKNISTFVDDDEWTDFVSSPSAKPQNGLNTISLNVHTNLNIQKTLNPGKYQMKNQMTLDIPTLNYITPKSNSRNTYNDRHFQNL